MGLFSGISKALFGGGGDKSSDAALKVMKDLETPEIRDMRIELEALIQQGVITPEQAEAALVEQSAFDSISLDPNLKASQLSALAGLQDISQGGMTDIERAGMNRIIQDEQTASRGAREAILQNAAARGMGGSGLELAAQLQNQQDASTRASNRGMDLAAQAQARSLEALMQSGQLAGNIRGQDMDEQARIAQAKDQIAQFNAQNKQQTNLSNTAARNVAQAQNLSEKQRVADSNTNTRNQQEMYNKNLIQQDFENKYKKAGGTAQGYQNLAAQQNENRKSDQSLFGTGLSAAAAFSDENMKKEIEEFNASDFLDEITGYRFKYKDQKHGAGEQIGVMAQDVERAAPQAVVDTSEGKAVDFNKLNGPILASLADMNDRLKKLGV